MLDANERFRTAKGRNEMGLAHLMENKKVIIMERSTGGETGPLLFDDLSEVHDLIHDGQLDLETKSIERYKPRLTRWGNYMTGVLKYLGTKRIPR